MNRTIKGKGAPMRRRRRRSSHWARSLKLFFQRDAVRLWAFAIVGIAILVTAVLLVTAPKEATIADTKLYEQSTITVGVSTECAAFAREEEGQLVGFDVDLIRLILSQMFGEKNVQIIEVPSQEASYYLRSGEIDLAIGAFSPDVLKTQGLALSNGYYWDNVYAYVAPNGRISELGGVQGKRVMVMSTEINEKTVRTALQSKNLETQLVPCSSYPDGTQAVLEGRAFALIAPGYKMQGREELTRLEIPLTTCTYHIMAVSGNSDVIKLMNPVLQSIVDDGRRDLLLRSWGLNDSVAVTEE